MKVTNEQKELIINQLNGVIKGEWSNSNGAEQYTTVDGGICKLYNTGTCQFQGKAQPKEQLEKVVSTILDGGSSEIVGSEDKQIFIVYGHDTTSREQLELILEKLNLNHSKIVNDSGMTIIEALESKISEIHCGIVLLTADDLAISKYDYEKKKGTDEPFDALLSERARQNVILELGMLIPVLGRENIIVLKKEGVEVPSDMSGVFYIGFEKHIKETVQRMAKRLKGIGFEITSDDLLNALD